MKLDKSFMLDRIKTHYRFKRDIDLARHLGIKPQVLSNWRKRNSFDAQLLYTKCDEINPSWLLTGDEPMLLSELQSIHSIQEESGTYFLQEKISAMEHQINALRETNAALKEANAAFRETIDFLKKRISDLETKS
ncbi:helix-turn-helix domain-containing protein [Sinomicrobium sp.]